MVPIKFANIISNRFPIIIPIREKREERREKREERRENRDERRNTR